MKPRYLVFVACLLLIGSVFAIQGPNVNNTDMTDNKGINFTLRPEGGNSTLRPDSGAVQKRDQLISDDDAVNNAEQLKEQTRGQIRERVTDISEDLEQKRQQIMQEAGQVGGMKGEMIKNQNEVRLAAQTMSQVANMMGGIGKEVSDIAKNFENSVQATLQAEKRIQTKAGFARFISGGDEKAAAELEKEVAQNQQRIQDMQRLLEECAECDDKVKDMVQEQLKTMEKEQQRLQDVARKEKKSKGLFGWLWK